MAPVVECRQGRHVAGGTSPGSPGGSGVLSGLAETAAAHASRTDLPVGRSRARHARLRNLDEDGHAVYRYLVAGAGLENHSAHHSASADRQGSILIGCTWFQLKTKSCTCCAATERSATDTSSIPTACTPPSIFRSNWLCVTTSTPRC